MNVLEAVKAKLYEFLSVAEAPPGIEPESVHVEPGVHVEPQTMIDWEPTHSVWYQFPMGTWEQTGPNGNKIYRSLAIHGEALIRFTPDDGITRWEDC